MLYFEGSVFASRQLRIRMRKRLALLADARWFVPLLLVLTTLAPYHRLLVGTALPVPDDVFISDLVDGEFPARVEVGRLLRNLEPPIWTSSISGGLPLIGSCDPLSMILFTALPPALALGWLLAILHMAGALGTYALSRHLGANRPGAFLAGHAFVWSGFFVCQLRHLGVLGTVAFFPLALWCLDRAATGGQTEIALARATPFKRRWPWLSGFAALLGLQLLFCFPQSAYISVLCYAALVGARALWLLHPADRSLSWRLRITPAAIVALGALAAVALGTLIGAVQLLPLQELGTTSYRSGGVPYEWATFWKYYPPNVLQFIVPYIHGDVSDLSYTGHSVFWEDYGYVGVVTFLLAVIVAFRRITRFGVAFWVVLGIVAYGLVLGPWIPLYRFAFDHLPGLSFFRFPTRFLFVVELALALLGGLGLTWLGEVLARSRLGARHTLAPVVMMIVIVAVAVFDLVFHNARQNPLADAARWLTPPGSVALIKAGGNRERYHSPTAVNLHMMAFEKAQGWSRLEPYYAHRQFLQPNSNQLYNVASLGGYAGIKPRWSIDLLGDHSRPGLLDLYFSAEGGDFHVKPMFFDLLEGMNVRWLILPTRVDSPRLQHVGSFPPAELYRLPGTMSRARLVTRVRLVKSADELSRLVESGGLDLGHEVVLYDDALARAMAAMGPESPDIPASARITGERSNEVVVEAKSPGNALLFLADTWYPGWQATIDGKLTQIYLADLACRAVFLPAGRHRIVFSYEPTSVTLGLTLSSLGLVLLLAGLLWTRRRHA